MPNPLTLLAVHAHPDDESIGTGGTFARYAAEGIRTVLVCCTRGEEGKIRDPDLDPIEAKGRLGAIREGELVAAAAILGIDELHILPYRDSGMAGRPANENPANFMNADPEEAAERVAEVIRATRPGVVVTYDERGGYGHPDHVMAHRVTLEAVARATCTGAGGLGWGAPKLYYTAIDRSTIMWVNDTMRARGLEPPFRSIERDVRQLAAPDGAITARVDVRPYLDHVRQALRAHRTQLAETDAFLALPPDVADRAFAHESYIRAFTHVAAPDREDDLFAGLRDE